MKYGDTLRQRSIPEWGHFNIDYDYLKELIKHHTTPGFGTAVSIPGQGETHERAFGDSFFVVLKAQHDRINLFVRSKSGEIERRLEHIGKSLSLLHARSRTEASSSRLPARTVEKYAKIDADVNKAGEEIRSLSRFRIAQRMGFYKILKKYKRWTRDPELAHRFKEEVTERPESFFQLDLGHLLDQYINVLGAIRAPFSGVGAPGVATDFANARSSTSRLTTCIEKGTTIDFDLALSSIPLGSGGNKATYWIHPDHIVEVEVLLLQHMQLYTGSTNHSNPSIISPYATPGRRKSSATADKYLGNEDYAGFIVLDHPESFAIKQNTSTVGASEQTSGTRWIRAAGHARWTSSGGAAVVVGLESNQNVPGTQNLHLAKLKRKHLEAFLDPTVLLNEQQDSAVFNNNPEQQSKESTQENTIVRHWLADHQEVRPIAGVCTRRTRFVGLHNGVNGGMWASLDRDCFMKSSLERNLKDDDWVLEARNNSTRFPHAILEIRIEGTHSTALLQTLERSHLVQRVRGFSLEAHAVWACCKPSAMTVPFWIPMLDTDIRKLPAPVKKQRRKASSVTEPYSQPSPPQTSTSLDSITDGHSTPQTPRNGESSATSADFVDPLPLRAFRKKSRIPYQESLCPIQSEPSNERQGYWNEYDHPENEDDGYYIYIDPNASVKFPGQEVLEAWIQKAKKFFSAKDGSDSPLSPSPGESSDDDDEGTVEGLRNYGTMSPGERNPPSQSYLSSLFHSIRDPHREAEGVNRIRRQSEHERRSLLGQLQIRQHKTEMTKLRFYSTCIATAVVIDIILTIMTWTSRRKERGLVDLVIMLGTIFNLLLCGVAVLSMRTRHERLGWAHQGFVILVVSAVAITDVLLLRWVLSI
ncbi:hypothetical protein BDV95DRAFT_386073 [Massariosphaeria phaeospora]|uniref:SPX domain-containing protein n=1 Tax=Massariosphaeria phaeospora TaxID=100035 RepID=A0A7C8MBJ2_9PLEO|nr:hypothetical protein BDV95DRAFT_386073 [Massariosphaeria phaeospora]